MVEKRKTEWRAIVGRVTGILVLLVGILLAELIDKLGAAGTGTAQEFQSDQDNVVWPLFGVHAQRLTTTGRQSNFVAQFGEHDSQKRSGGLFSLNYQDFHGVPPVETQFLDSGSETF